MALIYSMSVLFLCSLLQGDNCEYVNMSNIRYNFYSKSSMTQLPGIIDYVQFNVPTNAYNKSINCHQCGNTSELYFECTYNDTIWVEAHFKVKSQSCRIPFQIQCRENTNTQMISYLSGKTKSNSIQLNWGSYNDSLSNTNFIIFYMDGNDSDYKYLPSNLTSYLLKNLKEKRLFQICLATIYNSQTGPYRCTMQQTDYSEYLPVKLYQAVTSNDSVRISWYRPSDIPVQHNGYIIYYKDTTSDSCGVVIINMDQSTIPNIYYPCENIIITRHFDYLSPHSYTIKNLKPLTTYVIKIRAVQLPRYSTEELNYFTTLEGECDPVSSLHVSVKNGTLQIEYGLPINPNGILKKFMIKVMYQQNTEEYTQKQEVLFNTSEITSTQVEVPLMSPDKCAMYNIEVTPINGWTENNGVGRSSFILFQYIPEHPEIYDEYIRFSNRQLHISWSLNIASISYIWEYILRFNDAADQCIKSVHFLCQDCDDYSSHGNIDDINEIKKDELLNCSMRQEIDFKQNKNAVYGEIDIASSSGDFSVDVFTLSPLGINNICHRKTIYKKILTDIITEIFHYVDSLKRNLVYFWRLKIDPDAFIFEFIIRISLFSGECIESINYICESRGVGPQQGNQKYSITLEWDELRQCEQQSTEVFSEDQNFFGGSVNSNVTLDNITVSIYGLNRFGVHLLY